jgi:hypothetical protein
MRPSLRSLQISSILLSTFSTALVAQVPVAPRLQTGFNAIRESDLRSNLTFIAGDGLAGRMSLQPGDDAAAEWVVSEFAKAGLQPAATNASGKPSFLQPVPLIEYKPDPSATTLSLSRKDSAQQQWHAPAVSCAFRDNVDASGGLVYVGYGITAAELNYDDYANVDVQRHRQHSICDQPRQAPQCTKTRRNRGPSDAGTERHPRPDIKASRQRTGRSHHQTPDPNSAPGHRQR